MLADSPYQTGCLRNPDGSAGNVVRLSKSVVARDSQVRQTTIAVRRHPGLDGDDQTGAKRREDDGNVPEAQCPIQIIVREIIREEGVRQKNHWKQEYRTKADGALNSPAPDQYAD